MKFSKGNTYGKGRPSGSQNKTPNKALVVELLDKIVQDLTTNYNTLRTHEKIRILQHFARLYESIEISHENENRVFQVHIVRNTDENEETTKA